MLTNAMASKLRLYFDILINFAVKQPGFGVLGFSGNSREQCTVLFDHKEEEFPMAANIDPKNDFHKVRMMVPKIFQDAVSKHSKFCEDLVEADHPVPILLWSRRKRSRLSNSLAKIFLLMC